MKFRRLIIALAMSSLFSITAFAADTPTSTAPATTQSETVTETQGGITLDELKKQSQAQSQSPSTSDSSLTNILKDDSTGASSIAGISGMAKLDSESAAVKQVGGAMNSVAGKIVQLLGYIMSIGLGVSLVIDLVYLSVLPLRALMAPQNGGLKLVSDVAISAAGGSAQASSSPAQASGFNPSGFNSGFNSGFGPSPAPSPNKSASSSQTSPIKVWFKGRVIDLILAPTIFVLASTGVLTQIGFWLGQVLTGVLGKVPSMI